MKRIRKSQGGVALIEVLVAVVIFSLGMLGQVAFMLTAMKSGQQSRHRAIASYYAEEMFSMALSDTANRANYTVTNSACNSAGWAPCSQWIARLKADLPVVATTPVSVVYTAATGVMTVTVEWKSSDGSTENQKYSSTTNLNFIS